MKSILAFLAGAALAGALVYFTVRPKPAPEGVSQNTIAAEEPVTTVEKVPLAEQAGASSRRAPEVSSRPARSKPAPVRVAESHPPRTSDAPAQSPSPAPAAATTPPVQPTRQAEPAPAPPVSAPATRAEERQPATVTIPAGTLLLVRVDEALSTEKNASGDTFRATLDAPLIVEGMAIAERGARAQGRIVECDKGGKVSGVAHLTLELTTLNTADGQRVKLQTESFAREAEKSTKKDAAKVGIGAGVGAAIGAAAGGGKGAAIGAGAGGAAGAGDVLLTRGKAAELPAETRVGFRLAQPITLTEKL